jgi:hypothetical protein
VLDGFVTPFVLAMIALLAPAAARAGESACWFEQGVVVIPASVMGQAGDYILDTGTALTQLHDTRAQGAGFVGTSLTGEVRLAGFALAGRPVAVADLDVRAWNHSTPIAGVIGADVLSGFVVDVSFAPCRVRLSLPGHAPPFAGRRRLPLTWVSGRPAVRATVSDGGHSLTGDLVVATGSDTPVRLTEADASVPGAPKPAELFPEGVDHARLSALSLDGDLAQDLRAGLLHAPDAGGALGALGGPLLAHYSLRFDFPRNELLLAPAR